MSARFRLAVVIPSVNTVVEPWYSDVRPPTATLHFDRMLLDDVLTAENVVRMDQNEGAAAAKRLASCRPDALAYGCTASSIVQGWDYDTHLRDEMHKIVGVPTTTPCEAIRLALDTLGIRRIAVASPYTDEIDRREHSFFREAGFEIAGTANLNMGNSFDLASPSIDDMIELAHRAWNDRAEGFWSHASTLILTSSSIVWRKPCNAR